MNTAHENFLIVVESLTDPENGLKLAEKVLEQHSRPASPLLGESQNERLVGFLKQVSSATHNEIVEGTGLTLKQTYRLTYTLKEQGKAEKTADGRWRLVQQPTQPSSNGTVPPTATAPPAGLYEHDQNASGAIMYAMTQVMGDEVLNVDTIFERLVAKVWVANTPQIRGYIAYLLSVTKDRFESVPASRGFYRVNVPAVGSKKEKS
jgi:hypothetical protein